MRSFAKGAHRSLHRPNLVHQQEAAQMVRDAGGILCGSNIRLSMSDTIVDAWVIQHLRLHHSLAIQNVLELLLCLTLQRTSQL